jgi:bifunctional enzyme Fae/Hps
MRQSKIQLAFNTSFADFLSVVRYIPNGDHIIIEAGTPLIKKEGIQVVNAIKQYWPGDVCADMKVVDGAYEEVVMAKEMGATSITAMGTTSTESLELFVNTCKKLNIKSIIDMMNNVNPLKTIWKSRVVPDAVFIHRGRDEEKAFGKIIQYKDIAKIKGKYDIQLGAAGGIDKKELQSAIFNNADIVVVNIVPPDKSWKGIVFNDEFKDTLNEFLKFVNN